MRILAALLGGIGVMLVVLAQPFVVLGEWFCNAADALEKLKEKK